MQCLCFSSAKKFISSPLQVVSPFLAIGGKLFFFFANNILCKVYCINDIVAANIVYKGNNLNSNWTKCKVQQIEYLIAQYKSHHQII